MQDTNLFDEDAQVVALMNMASAAAHADRKLAQALLDVGLLQAVGPDLRPSTTNRRVKVAAHKLVEKWMRAAVRQINEQAASGTLDLSPPSGAIPVPGRQLSGPGVELRSQVESLIEEDKVQLQRTGGIAPVLIAETREGLLEFMLPSDKQERNMVLGSMMQQLLTQFETTAYLTIFDAWMSTAPMDGPMPTVRPSEDPQRQEVIILYFERKGGGSETWLVPYERRPDGIMFGETEHSTSGWSRHDGLLAARH